MPEFVFIFFIAIAVIAITSLLFGGWAVVTLLRFVFRGFVALFGDSSGRSLAMHGAETKICPHHGCGAGNPTSAQFCRRCGKPFEPRQMRRVAMW